MEIELALFSSDKIKESRTAEVHRFEKDLEVQLDVLDNTNGCSHDYKYLNEYKY